MTKKKLNPFILLGISKDLKRFLSTHHSNFSTVKRLDDVLIKINNEYYLFNLKNNECQEINQLPVSGNYVEISSDDMEKVAKFYGIPYELNSEFFENISKKIISRKTIVNYKDLLSIVDSSFETNITFNQLIRNFGGFLK